MEPSQVASAGKDGAAPDGASGRATSSRAWRVVTVLLAVGVVPAAAAPTADPAVRSLAMRLGFTDSELASVAGGPVITRVLQSREAGDVAIAGLLYARAPLPALLGQPAEARPFLTLGEPLQFGMFGDPPRPEDIARLRFDARELDAARGCEPRDCELKLDQATMERLRRLKSHAPDAKTPLADLLRESMIETLLAYRRDGSLPVYVDKEEPVSVAEGLRGILADSPHVDAGSPFLRHVLGYPQFALPDTRDAFYWSSEMLRKPIASVHHLVIHRTAEGGYAIADKHISDHHFFRARLELLWLFPAADAPGFHCLRLSLARIDLPGWFQGIVVGRIRRSARSSLARQLAAARRRIEGQNASGRTWLDRHQGLQAERVSFHAAATSPARAHPHGAPCPLLRPAAPGT